MQDRLTVWGLPLLVWLNPVDEQRYRSAQHTRFLIQRESIREKIFSFSIWAEVINKRVDGAS
jgi:hypothetical protein